MSKSELKKKAVILRKLGLGVKTIASRLKISSSTASIWCREIKLTDSQIKELQRRAHDPFYGGRKINILRQQQKRIKTVEKLRRIGIKEIGKLSKRELFVIGVALYWAEGFKKDKRLGFANSDPSMIKFFLVWLIKCCKVPKDKLRLRVGLNISHKDRITEVENYWSQITNIPIRQFQKPFFQKFVWKKEYPNPSEYFGVLRIRANKQLPLFRKINGWIEGLKINI